MKTKNSILRRNQKVAQNRGSTWKKSLKIGRIQVMQNPSVMRLKRVTMNLNQSAIATKVGLSLATLGAIEKGDRLVTEARAERVAKALKTRMHDIFRKEGEKYLVIMSPSRSSTLV